MSTHEQTIEVTDQEIILNDREYWIEGTVYCSGPLSEERIGGECHGVPSFQTIYTWEPTEADVLNMRLIQLNEKGEEFDVNCEHLKNLAKAKLKELAIEIGEENLEL